MSAGVNEDAIAGTLRTLLSSGRSSCRIRVTGLLGSGASAQVHVLKIGGMPHIVKVFDDRRQLPETLENYHRAGRSDRVVLASAGEDNPLGRDLLLLRVPRARVLHPVDLGSRRVRLGLTERLLSVYRHRTGGIVTEERLSAQLEEAVPHALRAVDRVVPELFQSLQDAVRRTTGFLTHHSEALSVPERILHNDLWWANIVVTPDERVYLVDWESVGEGDYLADLAQLRIMFHSDGPEHAFGPAVQVDFLVEDFLSEVTERIARDLCDTTANRRLAFYLSFMSIRRLALYDHEGLVGDEQDFVCQLADGLVRCWQPRRAGRRDRGSGFLSSQPLRASPVSDPTSTREATVGLLGGPSGQVDQPSCSHRSRKSSGASSRSSSTKRHS